MSSARAVELTVGHSLWAYESDFVGHSNFLGKKPRRDLFVKKIQIRIKIQILFLFFEDK